MPEDIKFKIPKQSDQSVVDVFTTIQSEITLANSLTLNLTTRPSGGVSYSYSKDGDPDVDVRWYLEQSSQLFLRIALGHSNNNDFRRMVTLDRKPESPFDEISIDCEGIKAWQNGNQKRERFIGELYSALRKHFKAADADASLAGTTDSEWTRYRDAQLGVLNALDNATKVLLVDGEKKRSAAEERMQEKYNQLESQLRDKIGKEQEKLQAEHERITASLSQRELELQKKTEAFNTKEARYVARTIQKDQIEELKKWITKLSLTSESTKYRWPVQVVCTTAVLASGLFAWSFSCQTVDFLTKVVEVNTPLVWWQWLALLMKPAIAFAAFVSFLVYYIRWSATWAHRLSEEDMRNRVRLLDVGRSQWLLEAIRDSQDHGQEFPVELTRELARNLFANPQCLTFSDSDSSAVGKALLQGLSSIRVKSPDGSEIEAKNESAKQKS